MSDIFNHKQQQILKRSLTGPASNYSDAVDMNFTKVGDIVTKVLDNITYVYNNKPVLMTLFGSPILSALFWGKGKIPTGKSNCTLTATQWVDPKHPISKAQTIIDNGNKYGYVEISEQDRQPGDLIIATNPKNNSHHTMLLTGFTKDKTNNDFNGKTYSLPKGHPIVRYSNGSTHQSGFRKNIGLMQYLDNSDGKTQIRYFRHYDNLLPEIIITPNK